MTVDKEIGNQFQEMWDNLDEWEKGVFTIMSVFSKIGDDNFQLLTTGFERMFVCHEKQHPKNKRCDKCEELERLKLTINMINSYNEEFKRLMKNGD